VIYGANPNARLAGRQSDSGTRTGPQAGVPDSLGPHSGSEFQEYQQSREPLDVADFPGWASAGQHAATRSEQPGIDDRSRQVFEFLREHRLICSLVAIGTLVRLVAMLAYPPALYTADSIGYLQVAIQRFPYQIRPDGYPFFLDLLLTFHSVSLVTTLQHGMGLAMGIGIYALLRHRYQLPAWGATLAAAPALLSAYAIQIEHYVLSDTLFAALVVLALMLVLWRPYPSLKMCSSAGLLLGFGALVRSQGLPLLVPFAIYILTRLNRRAIVGVVLMAAMFGAPLGAYAYWFQKDNGTFNLTSSTGEFLYGRVATFADCSIIKPPVDERFLCLNMPLSKRQGQGTYFVWSSQSPLTRGPAPEFSNEIDTLSTDFAIRAIEAQPAAYLQAVWESVYMAFELRRPDTPEGQSQLYYLFPSYTPTSVRTLVAGCTASCYGTSYTYNDHKDPSTRLVGPFARWIQAYQRFAVMPGPLVGLIVLAGMASLALSWRRLGNPVLLPWLVGMLIVVTPAATALFDARYLVAAIPPLCIAAGVGVPEINGVAMAVIGGWRLRRQHESETEPVLG
jgi:hypothetical protein